MKSSLRFSIVLGAILIVGLIVNSWSYLGEAHVDRRPLKDFPQQLGNWNQFGTDQQLDAPTLKVLRASDYLSRNYRRTDGRVGNIYIGYYASQRDGATYHSPLNCLPGSGWNMSDPRRITITTPGGSSFTANQYFIQSGSARLAMIYWYQGRGRAVASEYWGKVYTVLDSVRLRRSDGALVRITVPVGDSESTALAAAAELASTATGQLGEFVPN
jgi:EpsI family protein